MESVNFVIETKPLSTFLIIEAKVLVIDDTTFKKKVTVEIKVLVANDIIFATKAMIEETILTKNALMAETTLVMKVLMAPITAKRAFLRAVATATMPPASADIRFREKFFSEARTASTPDPIETTALTRADISFLIKTTTAFPAAFTAPSKEVVRPTTSFLTAVIVLRKNVSIADKIAGIPVLTEWAVFVTPDPMPTKNAVTADIRLATNVRLPLTTAPTTFLTKATIEATSL